MIRNKARVELSKSTQAAQAFEQDLKPKPLGFDTKPLGFETKPLGFETKLQRTQGQRSSEEVLKVGFNLLRGALHGQSFAFDAPLCHELRVDNLWDSVKKVPLPQVSKP
jgi:hypothetical protein